MNITLLGVPYGSGREREGMGLGPVRYAEAGAAQRLSEQGFEVRMEMVRRDAPFEDELSAVRDINTRLRDRVRGAVAEDSFPLVLGGGCNVCLGVLSGLDPAATGILWFDAHGDFNTPETTPSNFFDGMPLAIATGGCYPDLWAALSDQPPVPESHTLLLGARDLDPGERDRLDSSEVVALSSEDLRGERMERNLVPALEQLRARVGAGLRACPDVYLHLDIDVLDPDVAPGVNFRTPDGLSIDDLESAVGLIAERFHIAAASLTAFDPHLDEDDRTLQAGLRLMETVAITVAHARQSIGT